MPEGSEKIDNFDEFASGRDRLRFVIGSIRDLLRDAYKEPREELQKVAREKGFGGDMREVWELRDKLEKRINKTMTLALNTLRGKLSHDARLHYYLPEVNALIGAVRIMLIQKSIVHYKEYQLAMSAPKLSPAEIREQNMMREDLTEEKALLQCHILQNEGDENYIKDFLSALNELWSNEGFTDEKESFMRGLVQELGVYKLLKKHFPKVTPATPQEDAHHAIDFWVETKSGKKLMIQSKSSGMFGRGGIFNEMDVIKLREEIEQRPDEITDYWVDLEGQGHIPHLVRVKKLERDFGVAKKYAEDKGIENPEMLLIISNSGNFERPTGKPKAGMVEKLEDQMERVAAR